MRIFLFCAFLMALGGPALAQSPTPGGMPPPPGMSLTQSAAMRFPQPVRVGTLLHEAVQQPVESQIRLGTVAQLVRAADGTIDVVVDYGGFFAFGIGFGGRPIAVPVDGMVLLGPVMEIVAFTPEQLRKFPTFSAAGTTPIPPDTIIKVGLAKPSH